MLKEIANPKFRGLVIRRNADDLSDWVDRASILYKRYGADIAYRPAIIKFPSGAIIRTGHLKDDQAYTKYQGHEYQRILIEELTQIPDEKRYIQLITSCRSTVPNLDARVFATTNPGGIGHSWVKHRFVDVSPAGIKYLDPYSKRTRIFIPARVEDTPQLAKNDPNYVNFLDSLKETDVELWKAWRLGDWTTFAGQYFREWQTNLHVIPPFIPSKNDLIVGSMDWGRTHAFAFYLTVISKVEWEDTSFYRSKVFFEVWGHDKNPKEWSDIIKENLKLYKLGLKEAEWLRADPAIFTKLQDNSMSIADQFNREGIRLQPASNDRLSGWENIHKWLSLAPDGLPYLQFTSNCINAIRTIPELVHDDNRVEDLNTEGEDDSADSIRYLHAHLKWLDGRAGGIGRTRFTKRESFTAAIDPLTGKQVSIDLGAFAKPKKGRYYK